ncbi:MMPL family transporter [Rhodococcus qingshengii]|uniref:MMPL family transporter n=1 Tax=Rhodococcus qingshengii TaxID=334542 RepID=UPI0035D93DED
MGRLLYRLGAFSATHRKTVLAAWVAVLAAVLVGLMSGPQTNSDSFEIPGTESSDALSALSEKFPSAGGEDVTSLDVVFHADGSLGDPVHSAAVADTVAAINQVEDVTGATNPLAEQTLRLSSDGATAVSTVTYSLASDDDKGALNDRLVQVAQAGAVDGLEVVVGGDLGAEGPHLFGPSEIIGLAVALLVLLITYGSMVAAGVNMLTALIGVAVGICGVLAYSAMTPIQPTTPILAVMLGLAVGIDYTLFVLARYRSELREGKSVLESVSRAVGTAGSAVVFAGATVVIALAGLSVVGVPFLTEMGLAAAFGVIVAVLVALTLLPVILVTVGRRVLPRKHRGQEGLPGAHASTDKDTTVPTFYERWGALVAHKPKRLLIPAVLALALVSIPLFSLSTSLNTPGGADPESSQRQAYDLISEGFGAGSQSPMVILVESDDANTAGSRVVNAIADVPYLASMSPVIPNADNTAAMINVVSEGGPNDHRTADLVNEIRAAVSEVSDASVAVTGETAVSIDVDAKLHSALIMYIALIVGLAFVLLTVLFRSFFVPLVATIGFLLSLGAGMGASIAVFQWGWLGSVFGVSEGAPILSFLPIIVVGILFGLAMDYQVFLVSRIHEAHVRGLSTKEAIIDGFARSGPVVAAAATIMAAVFGGFMLSGDSLVGSIALALTVGVIVDAFVVRMIIVPAALSLMGDRSWWLPAALDRVLPKIDAEGHDLDADEDEMKRLVTT